MKVTSKDSKKQKIKLSKSPLTYCQSFIRNNTPHFLLQCLSHQVFAGYATEQFQLLRSGQIPQKITSIAYCYTQQLLYAGTINGLVYFFSLQISQPDNISTTFSKIPAINNQPILAMFAYHNSKDKLSQLITINSEGILTKYQDNKYSISVQFPFKIHKAISNKSIQTSKSVAMILLPFSKKHLFIFPAELLIQLCDKKSTKQQLQSLLSKYQQHLTYYPQQQSTNILNTVNPSQISHILITPQTNILILCKSKNIIISTIEELGKQKQYFWMLPNYQLQLQQQIISLDVIDSDILIASASKIFSFNIFTRKKKSILTSKKITLQCNIVYWVTQSKILYTSTQSQKMKMTIYELSKK